MQNWLYSLENVGERICFWEHGAYIEMLQNFHNPGNVKMNGRHVL